MVGLLRANHSRMGDAEMRLLMPKFFGRTREPFGGEMPSWWDAEAARPGPRLVFALVDDVGPATKILGNLQAEEEGGLAPGDLYVSVDDDHEYVRETLDHLVLQHSRAPGSVVCYSGIRFTRQLDGTLTQRNTSHILGERAASRMRPSLACVVDLAEGFGSVLYPREALLGLAPLHGALLRGEVPPFAMRGDDYLIGNALAALGVTRLAVLHPVAFPRPLSYGFGEDALHSVDGSNPVTRYRPIMDWCAQVEGAGDAAAPQALEHQLPLLRDAFWRDPYERNDLTAVPASAAASAPPGVAWAVVAGIVILAGLLAVLLRVRNKARFGSRFPSAVALLLLVGVALAVALAPERLGKRSRGGGGRRRLRHPPLGWLRYDDRVAAATVPPCWPSAEFADLRYEPGAWRMCGAGKGPSLRSGWHQPASRLRRSPALLSPYPDGEPPGVSIREPGEGEFADADDPLGTSAGTCEEGYPSTLSTRGPFLELADGRCAVVGPGGVVRIVARSHVGSHASKKQRRAGGRVAIAVVAESRERPSFLARHLAWRHGPLAEPSPLPEEVIVGVLAGPPGASDEVLRALIDGGLAPPGCSVHLLGGGGGGGSDGTADRELEGHLASWSEAAAARGITLRQVEVPPGVHPALALAAPNGPEPPAEGSIVVTLPADAAAAEHLGAVVARARALPRCAVAAEADVVIVQGGVERLEECPAGCTAAVMDSAAGAVAYRVGALRRAAAAGAGGASGRTPSLGSAPLHSDTGLSGALAATGTTVLRQPDPYVAAPRRRRRQRRGGPASLPASIAARSIRVTSGWL
jgi:hypothetical protein